MKKFIKWVLILIFGFIAVGFISTSLMTAVVVESIDQAVNATPEPAMIYSIGDSAIAGDVTVSLTKTEWSEYNSAFKPNDGCEVYGIYVTVTNISDKDKYISSNNFKCYADNAACESYIWNSNTSLPGSDLSPQRSVSGWVYFNVPVEASEIEVEYSYDYKGSKVIFKLGAPRG